MDPAIATVLVAAIAAVASVASAIITTRSAKATKASIQEVHVSLNSRLTQLLKETAASSRAEGVAEERERSPGGAMSPPR